jgi:hypothetical protein
MEGGNMQQFASVDDVVKLILNTVDEKSSVGIMGHALLEFATRTSDTVTEEDKTLFKQMKELKEAEDRGDLFWIDYTSWNAVGTVFREYTTNLIKPLFWNGVFTTYNIFRENEVKILSRMNPSVVANLIRCGRNYQLYCVDHSNNNYTFMKTREFDELASRVKSNLLRSYTKEGSRLMVKDFNIAQDEQKRGNEHGKTKPSSQVSL